MNTIVRRPLLYFCFLLPILLAGCVKVVPSPPPQPPPPDVVSRVTSAKKIFLSNAGADGVYAKDQMIGGADGGYNGLYTSLKQWGRFQLVESPIQADLVFEIRSTVTIDTASVSTAQHHSGLVLGTTYSPFFNLSILDSATGTALYKIVMPAGQGDSLKAGRIAFAKSIDALTGKIRDLVTDGSTQATPPAIAGAQAQSLSQTAAMTAGPIPGQVRTAKKVFIQNGASGYSSLYNHFVAALTAWGYYTLVDSPEKADVVFDFELDGIAVSLPSSKIKLWTVSDPMRGSRKEQGRQVDGVIIGGLISNLKSIAGVS
jgi:hypothetical protein